MRICDKEKSSSGLLQKYGKFVAYKNTKIVFLRGGLYTICKEHMVTL